MTFCEYKAVMDELNIPKFEIKKGMKFSLKEKLRIKLHDYRDAGEGIFFLHNIHSICIGDIPSSVIRDTYFRLGKECFMRGDKFETLRHNDLNQVGEISSFRIGNLRDYLVFSDTFLRHLSH